MVRGAFDLGGVVNRMTARSKYGGKFSITLYYCILLFFFSEETEDKEIDHYRMHIPDMRKFFMTFNHNMSFAPGAAKQLGYAWCAFTSVYL